jgi:hypothetical protein
MCWGDGGSGGGSYGWLFSFGFIYTGTMQLLVVSCLGAVCNGGYSFFYFNNCLLDVESFVSFEFSFEYS